MTRVRAARRAARSPQAAPTRTATTRRSSCRLEGPAGGTRYRTSLADTPRPASPICRIVSRNCPPTQVSIHLILLLHTISNGKAVINKSRLKKGFFALCLCPGTYLRSTGALRSFTYHVFFLFWKKKRYIAPFLASRAFDCRAMLSFREEETWVA